MLNHLLYIVAMLLLLAGAIAATYAYWLWRTGRETISDRIARYASQWVRGLLIGLITGLVIGALLAHWGWPTVVD